VTAPLATTSYDVEVRCSTLPGCTDSETVLAQVNCPSTDTLKQFSVVNSTAPGIFFWEPIVSGIPGEFQVYRGPLADLPNFVTGSVIASNQTGVSYVDGDVPPVTDTYYMFARDGSQAGLACNETPFSWSGGGGGETNAAVGGTCDDGGNGSALGQACTFDSDCQAIAGILANCVQDSDRDQNGSLPAP
jgi:hypothetical protein